MSALHWTGGVCGGEGTALEIGKSEVTSWVVLENSAPLSVAQLPHIT